jgi:hypothetical protein
MFDDINIVGSGAQIISILVGIAALTLGRKLFWLFVGVVGFVVALSMAAPLFNGQPEWIALTVALVVGALGALIAMFIQKIAVAIAGFLIGGYVLVWLSTLLGLGLESWNWLMVLVGGGLGSIFSASLFEVALIVLSSVAGSVLIATAFDFRPVITALLFLGLVIVGIVVQVKIWRDK